MSNLKTTEKWDKVFPKSDKVSHEKITFHNKYGITLVADLPFVNGEQLDDVFEHYYERKKPAMCVSVPEDLFLKHGIKPTLVFDGLVPTGVNLLLANNDEQDQTIYESENIELAFNINTLNDLDLSKHYIEKNDI